MIRGLQRQSAADGLVEKLLDLPRFVGIQPENLAQVHASGMHQPEPVRLGPRHRFFMGVNAALAERFQPHPSHETFARMPLPFDLELLVVDV